MCNEVGPDVVLDNPKDIIGKTLVELGRINEDIVFVSCDTSMGTGASQFKKEFPDRHFEFGIQEQNAVNQSAGMAMSGMIPIIGAHVPFIVLKTVEQIRDDLCKTKQHVIIIGRDFGLQLSMLGPTHMILEDIAVLRALPNITIIGPSDGPEYRHALMESVKLDGPVYIRMSRQKTRRINNENYSFKIGKANKLMEGKDITLIATSTMVANAFEAVEILNGRGIEVDLINMHTIKPLDKEIILESSMKTKRVVTLEEHSVIGGLGSAVAEVLVRTNPVKMDLIGTEDHFSITGSSYDELLDYYGFTPKKIATRVENFLNTF